MSSEANTNITAIIDRVDALYEPYFTSTDQSDTACFYYPTFSTNEPVILPGRCDVNVPVETSFDVTRVS